jgi:ADP-ribosylglycohydrolase
MEHNNLLLEWLFEEQRIRLNRGPIFDLDPGPVDAMARDRVEGMLLGLAIGDALGYTTEAMRPGERRRVFGEIRDYRPGVRGEGRTGLPSDDTQLAFWTLEQLLEDGHLVPEHVARRFLNNRAHIRGIGRTVRAFLDRVEMGYPWYEAAPHSAGNGALMRIAPIILPHLRTGTRALWRDAALLAMLTHNDAASTAGCLAFVFIWWQLLQGIRPDHPDWWIETYVSVARPLETSNYRPRGGEYLDFEGPVWQFVARHVPEAYYQDMSVREACDRWYSGAFLLETVPSVLYILMRHADDPEEAIVRAVNDTYDNDTIAAIVGATVGAMHGAQALPERWRRGLPGELYGDDLGRVQWLITQAMEHFGP